MFIYNYLHFVVDFHGIHVGKYTVRPMGPMAWEWKWVPQILQGSRFPIFPLFGAPIFRIWDSLQKIPCQRVRLEVFTKDRSLQEKVFEVLGFSKEEVQMDDKRMTGGRVLGVFCRRFYGEKTGVFLVKKRETMNGVL